MGPAVFAGNALYGGHQFIAILVRSREWLAHKEPTLNKWLHRVFSQAYELELSVAGDTRSQSIALLVSPYKCLLGITSIAPLMELLAPIEISP